jgi:hypothetical protein
MFRMEMVRDNKECYLIVDEAHTFFTNFPFNVDKAGQIVDYLDGYRQVICLSGTFGGKNAENQLHALFGF